MIGYVGRIMPEKDLDTWLRAAAMVAQQYPQARFVLVGEGRDGETLHQLQKLAATLGIAERVIFPGYRQHLLPVYATFDLFVLSSRREGLPNSLLEPTFRTLVRMFMNKTPYRVARGVRAGARACPSD